MEVRLVDTGNVSVVFVSGKLEIEKSKLFPKIVGDRVKNRKIVFSLENLNFVGSSGIKNFFQGIFELREKFNLECKISGLNKDFLRLLAFSSIHNIEMHDSLTLALQSFTTAEAELPR